MTYFSLGLDRVKERIYSACQRFGRDPAEITLVAVSKLQPLEAVQAAAAAGCRDFGENFVQEALPKIEALAGSGVRWHFIGHLQSNKTRDAATHFDWVHTVDREKIARRLSAQRPPGLPPLNVCIQVHLGGEDTKSGVEPDAARGLAEAVAGLPRLRLRGLMTLPPPEQDLDAQRRWFARLARLRDALREAGFDLDTLSMGMSADLEAAIAEGATLVRIGTAVFGERPGAGG